MTGQYLSAEAAEMLRFIGVLDCFPDMNPEQRARVFAAWEKPGAGRWVAARSILIRSGRGDINTLWQAALVHNPALPVNGTPTAVQIDHALRSEAEKQ